MHAQIQSQIQDGDLKVDDSGSVVVNDDPERLEMIAQRSKMRRAGKMAIGVGNAEFPSNSLLDRLNEEGSQQDE